MDKIFEKYGFKLKSKKEEKDSVGKHYHCVYEKEVVVIPGVVSTCVISYSSWNNNTNIDIKENEWRLHICSRYEPKTKEQMEFLLTGSSRLMLFTKNV